MKLHVICNQSFQFHEHLPVFVLGIQRHLFFLVLPAKFLPKQPLSEQHLLAANIDRQIFKARLPHEQRRFIVFVCSAQQIQGGEEISNSSRWRDSFYDFIIDLPIYVTPCSSGSTFVLFVLSLFQTQRLCSTEEGQMD